MESVGITRSIPTEPIGSIPRPQELIEAVASEARAHGCPRYYWLTQQHNVRARGLYDKVARFAGFIRYDYPMNPS